jgi:hypothetical protein
LLDSSFSHDSCHFSGHEKHGQAKWDAYGERKPFTEMEKVADD